MSTALLPRGTADRVIETLWPEESAYRWDPVSWAEDRLGASLWSAQRSICDSVAKHRFTAVRSCHGVGKSFTAGGVVIPWWMDVHPEGAARVVSTAPSQTQVEAILWNEIGTSHARAGVKGRITHGQVPMWKVGQNIYGFGRKPQDLANEDQARQAFQGIHADFVLVVLDEACGIPGWLWEAVESLVTNDECRVLAIGNPDDPQSHFRTVCESGEYNVIHVSAFDSPNFTDEEVPASVASKLVGPGWVEERRRRWGEHSPLWMSKVLGEFPDDTVDGVIPVSWMVKCRAEERPVDGSVRELGCDVGAGGDESVIAMRVGMQAMILHRDHNPDTMATARLLFQLAQRHRVQRVKVDSIGIGQGVTDRLKELIRESHFACEVLPVNVGERSDDPSRFGNLRDQIWWEVGRELSENRSWDLSQVDDDVAHQLCAPRYKPVGGRIKVEPKSDTKKRLGSSPDLADAVLLAFYEGRPKSRWRMR